jgi:excisionase family DNA binding protein
MERSADFLNTVEELAERWGVHPITVRRMIERGELKAVQFARRVRIRESEVERYLAEHEKAPA